MKIEISIVIAWNGSARSPKSARSSESARSPEHKSLNKCLEALLAPRMRLTRPSPSVQVILSIGSKPRGMKVDSYLDDLNRSSVELIQFDEPVSLPLLRQAGIEKAQGDVIVMLDPYAIVEENWLEELREAHARQPHLAIGGAVGLYKAEEQGLAAWAIYINEYGGFMPPLKEGVVHVLPGCNISYKRKAWEVLSERRSPKPGFWKAFFNFQLEDEGHSLWLHPPMAVRLHKPVTFGDFLRTRYLHGRCFAGMRRGRMNGSRGMSLPERWLRAFSAPLLLLIFLWRMFRRPAPSKLFQRMRIRTLPLQALLFGNWAIGEMVGYLFGPGNACERLYY